MAACLLAPAGDFSLVWRPEAKVSVLDSGFMLGDGVWEGIRLHGGVLLFAQVRLPTTARRWAEERAACEGRGGAAHSL